MLTAVAPIILTTPAKTLAENSAIRAAYLRTQTLESRICDAIFRDAVEEAFSLSALHRAARDGRAYSDLTTGATFAGTMYGGGTLQSNAGTPEPWSYSWGTNTRLSEVQGRAHSDLKTGTTYAARTGCMTEDAAPNYFSHDW